MRTQGRPERADVGRARRNAGPVPVRRHRWPVAAAGAVAVTAVVAALLAGGVPGRTVPDAGARSPVLVAAAAPGAPAGDAVPGRRAATSRAAPAGAAVSAERAAAPAVLRRERLDALLARRAEAVLARDEAAFLATVDPAARAFTRRQAAMLANLAHVPLAGWRYEYAGPGPGLPPARRRQLGPGAATVTVVLAYRLAGAGGAEVRRRQTLTLTRPGGRWLLAGDADGPTAQDLWDLGPVSVAPGERSLVLGTVAAGDLDRYVAEADEAAARVDAVLGTAWPRTVVVLVPRDQAEMGRLLGGARGEDLTQVAAVTTGETGLDRGEPRANRVVVSPAGFGQLGPLGRSVVLTHEVTHVATRATATADLPVWLSEGFADYVAYSGTALTPEVVAADVLDQVRAGRAPTVLPTAADFDPARHDIAPAYSGAWLACVLIERRYGRQAVVDLYRAVAGGQSVDSAMRAVLGTDLATFEHQWSAYLRELG